jgi:rare lipoprotein A
VRVRLALLASVLLMAACAGPQTRDTTAPHPHDLPDGPPPDSLDVSRIIHPEPRPEPRSPYGNHSPYEVFGQTYHVKTTAEGYQERGIASWYGTRFHGRATSSGEPYDMYKLTAAHRTLPLPTFAEVRSVDNGRSIIVRINDRGPFHPDRIIDLSWAAAVKLGIDQAGTGKVEVRAITFDDPIQTVTSPARLPVLLQVGAFSERERAAAVKSQLSAAGIEPVRSQSVRTPAGSVWRVQVGPLDAIEAVFELAENIVALGLGRPQYVYP